MKTYTYIKRLADLTSFGKIAKINAVETQTAEAWGREPESNANPFGTGKKNPLDSALRLIALAHKEGDTVLAREMAELFPEYVAYLDGMGRNGKRANVNELIGSCVKEHSEAVVSILNSPRPDFPKAFTEIKEAIVALEKLSNWVREEMRSETLRMVN